MTDHTSAAAALERRFGEPFALTPEIAESQALQSIATRGSCRAYSEKPVELSLLRDLTAISLSSPAKSDLQQRDIVILDDPSIRQQLAALLGPDDWTSKAPAFLVFCGNNRRQRQIHQLRDRPFANDHLDAFFNASVDAAIALSAFVLAAEAIGLGCCPVSQIRNHAHKISDLLELPDHVFPVAGLGVGWPQAESVVSLRLPLSTTVHVDRFCEDEIESDVAAYDQRRKSEQPYADPERTWSEAKAYQYAQEQRADFGAFIRAKGFRLD